MKGMIRLLKYYIKKKLSDLFKKKHKPDWL